jgi:hypothetical protein
VEADQLTEENTLMPCWRPERPEAYEDQKMSISILVRSLLLHAALICPAAFAQTEELCLNAGRTAEVLAKLMHAGQTEELVLADVLEPIPSDSKNTKAQQKIIDETKTSLVRWVFTTRPTPQTARGTVYSKCMTGGLGSTDLVKFKAVGKSKQR